MLELIDQGSQRFLGYSDWESINSRTERPLDGGSLKPTMPILLDCNIVLYAATVVLDSSVGMRQSCPGGMVTYTCTVRQGLSLDWIVEPFFSGSTPLRFLSTTPTGSSQDCNDITAPNCSDFGFVATLTDVNPDLTSTLTFTAAIRLNGTVVQCRGTTADGFPMSNSTFNVAGEFVL